MYRIFRVYGIVVLFCLMVGAVRSQSTNYQPLYTASTFVKNIDTNLPVGSTPGVPGVSNGSSVYNIPISVPVGTNGMEPGLSVVYSSMGGNGILGQGWSLSGLSVITRVAKNHYMDGKVSGVNLDIEDAFSLDGQRLILVDGINGVQGAVYRKEVDDFSVITMQGQSGQGPGHIVVETKDGLVYEYGNSSNSRFTAENSNTVLIWRLSRIISKEGNYIEFRYINDDRNTLVDEILYTGNDYMSLSPYNRVKFEYTQRLDKGVSYEAGQRISSKYLLSRIRITSGGSYTYKVYEFGYGHNNITSYLNEITEKGSSGIAINSTIFSYGAEPADFSVSPTTVGQHIQQDYLTGDINADGYSDFIGLNRSLDDDGKYVLYNSFTSYAKAPNHENTAFAPYTTVELPDDYVAFKRNAGNRARNQVVDINGDGRHDLLFTKLKILNSRGDIGLEELRIYESPVHGTEYGIPRILPSLPNPSVVHDKSGNFQLVGDFDGDGKTDVVTMLGNYVLPSYNLMYFNRVWYEDSAAWQLITLNGGSTISLDDWASCDKVYVLDFDGDGKDDIMVIRQGQSEIFTFETRTTVKSIRSGGFPTVWHHIYMGDFNGDGKTDLLTRTNPSDNNAPWYLALSTGKGFVESPFVFEKQPKVSKSYKGDQILISDYNGDGKSDIAHCWNDANGTSKIDVYYSRGIDFYRERHDYNEEMMSVPEYVLNFDSNGDGRAEVLNAKGYFNPKDILYIRKEGQQHLLQGIKDGHNVGTNFTYRRMTQSSGFYSRDTIGGYPIGTIQAPLYLTESMSRENGIGGEHTTKYRYKNAMLHKLGRGWLGFEETRATDLVTGFEVTSRLRLDSTYYLFLPKAEKTRYLPSGTLIEERTFYSSIVPMGGKRFWVKTDSIANNRHFETKTVFTTYAYDAYGNQVEEKVDNNGVELYTTNTGYGQFGGPFPSKPTVLTKRTDRTGESPYATNSLFSYNALGQLTSEEIFPGTLKSVLTTYVRDDFGNVISRTTTPSGLPPVTETFTYDGRARFPISSTNALGQVSTAQYDQLWGKPIWTTDVGGLSMYYEYDLLGRLISTTDFPRNFVTSYKYSWNSTGTSDGGYHIRKYYHISGRPESKVYYDKLGREVATEVDAFPSGKISTYTNYDSRGNVSSAYGAHKSGESPLVNVYGYDEYNRVTVVSNALGATQYEYDYQNGNLTVTQTDPGGQVSKKVTDAGGKLVTAVDDGGSLFYTYYSHSGVKSVVDGSNNILILSEYDVDGSQTKLTDINAGTTEYVTDALGRQTRMKTALGQWTTYDYDILNRMTEHNRPEGSSVYTYYGSGLGGSTNQLEKIVTYGGVEESYTYDGVGRVLTRTDKVDNEVLTTSYTYNNFDDVTEVIYPSGLQLKYDYDNKGYLRQISNGGTAIFTAIERNGLGQNTSYRLGNGKKTTKEYYHGVPTSYYSVGLQDLEFEWNYASMNLTGRTDNIKGKSEEFTYDGLNRLTGSAGSLGVSTMWTMYEPNGNILAKSDVGRYRYEDSKINAVTWVSNQPLPPDNFPVHDQDVVYTSFYQPLTITEGADKVEFQYGSDDQRIRMRKTKNNVEEYRRYYFGDYELQLEPIHGIVRFIHYISSGNELVAIAERELRAGSSNSEAIHYVYADYLGSILTMTNASGAVEYEQNFDAWGRNRDVVTWNYVPTSLTPPRPLWLYRGYTGHEHLEEFGIVNMNGRLYDPLVSRMFSPDNYVQMPDNLQNYNRYSYVLNNPLSYTDPSGEIIWAPILIGAAIGGVMNVGVQAWNGNIDSGLDVLAAFGIGALAGGVGAATGGMALAGSGLSGGFAAGAFVGGVGGGASGIIAGTGNALYFQDADLADALGQGLKEGAIGFGSGILLGGVIGYLTTPPGYNPMNGKLKPGGRLVSASYDDIIELGQPFIEFPAGSGRIRVLANGEWVEVAAKTGLTNSQLVQKSATLAERAIGGTGGVAGTAKHQYASKLLNRYQSIYGNRGLETGLYFNKGVGNRGFLDVIDHTNGIIYDFKFGKAVMSPAQYNKYFNNFGLPIQVIRP